jgi:hypothetical protein
MAADVARAMIADSSATIVVPKMSDALEEIVGRASAKDLDSRVAASGQAQSEEIESKTDTVSARAYPSELAYDIDGNRTGILLTDKKDAANGKPSESQVDDAATKITSPDEKSQTSSISQEATSPENTKVQEAKTLEGRRDQAETAPPVESSHFMDLPLAKLLATLPSAECLPKLDFVEFKAKMTTARKSSSGSGASQTAASMEPIFKKLTDEIKSLQTSLSIHDQFTKTSISCYQRVLFDLIVEMEMMRTDQGQRLARLEEAFQQSQASMFVKLWRWLGHTVAALWLWGYSIAYLWISTLVRFYLSLPGIAFRFALSFWPSMKNLLLATKPGSELANRLSPFIRQIDELFDNLETNELTEDLGLSPDPLDQTMWKFPVLTTIVALCFCRLIMCFTTSNAKRADASTIKTKPAGTALRPKEKDEDPPPLTDDETNASSNTS